MVSLAKWERWFVCLLFLLSVAIRFLYLSEISHNPYFDHPRLDALYHDIWAQSIASGNIIGNDVFFRAPFYPYFLGALYALAGHNYVVPRVVQHILGSLCVVLLYVLARKLFGRLTAVLASLLAATYAVLIYFEGELLFDSILTFLCVVLSVVVYSRKGQQGRMHWFVVGFVFGIICITRPTFFPFVLGLVAYAIILYRKTHGDRKSVV
jgi:4-amino-4-deoxy-L-arabinose transferase-like glycosyltransferase